MTERVLGGILAAFGFSVLQLHGQRTEQVVISWPDNGFVFPDCSSMESEEKNL